MEEDTAKSNHRNLRRLVISIKASFGKLDLLMAICDNWKYRDELIRKYEEELTKQDVKCRRLKIDNSHLSMKQGIWELIAQEPDLEATDSLAVVSVLGADELLGIRLNELKSAQEKFFFSLQWTREALREFRFPIVIWLTPSIAAILAQQAPDFWSWRGGVFEFSMPVASTFPEEKNVKSFTEPFADRNSSFLIDTVALQEQIQNLQTLDANSPLLGSLYNSLGNAYKDKIQYADAEASYVKALKLSEFQIGIDHPNTADSLNNLAELYRSQGRYSEAEPLYLRSLQIIEQELGADHPDTATSLNNLAGLYESQGCYSEAEPLYLRSLQIREQQLGADHPDTATSLFNLAVLYHNLKLHPQALRLIQQAIQIFEQTLGGEHPTTKSAHSWLHGIRAALDELG
jgi:tetratricopeptide (TPR) repeat protein